MAAAAAVIATASTACGPKAQAAQDQTAADSDSVATVYFIKDITPENLVKIYKALGRDLKDSTAVKISTGESTKSNQLNPDLIAQLIAEVNGRLVECNTAYPGNRMTTEDHRRAIAEHGYTNVDIMDADGDTTLVITDGFHLPYDIVGKHIMNYGSMLVLSHFKGHAMGGFGGALKNIAIGCGSTAGKTFIHSAGLTSNADSLWQGIGKIDHDDFLESMADACKGVINHFGKENMAYINVANRLSVDCDCNGNPEAPQMGDLGIFASLDPVALDRACVDAVFNSTDPGKEALIERIKSRNGEHTIEAAEKHGLGTTKYKIVTLD